MSEASSHAASADSRLDQAIAGFETPRAVALTCLDKHPNQIMAHLLDVADVAAQHRGFPKDGPYARMLAFRYAAEAIEWLWKQTDVAEIR